MKNRKKPVNADIEGKAERVGDEVHINERYRDTGAVHTAGARAAPSLFGQVQFDFLNLLSMLCIIMQHSSVDCVEQWNILQQML